MTYWESIHFKILMTKSNDPTLLPQEPGVLESESRSEDHHGPAFEGRLEGIDEPAGIWRS